MKKYFLFALLLLCAVVCSAQKPVPQLPQTYIDTTFNAPTGATWAAHTSTDFRNALSSASPGDTIVLDAGATYQGNFTLPAKSNPNNQWIYIVGSAVSSLPAPGTRVNPATDSAKMPKIVTPGMTAPLTLSPGANHYRLVGLEVYTASTQGCNPNTTPPTNCYSYELVYAGSVPGHPLVDSITVDRCYIHGSPTLDVQHAVIANGSNFAVIDSYISEIHMFADTQAIGAWYSPGPIKIVNNYLEATGENVMFGGAGGLNNPWVPSDIEMRNNWLFKPLSWDAVGVTIPPSNKWVVKNLLELKSARRVLVDGNTLENVWMSGQNGYALVFGPRTNSSGLLAVVDDITVSNNILKNVSTGFDVFESDDGCLPANGCTNPGEMKRVVLYNNLILLGNTSQLGYSNGFGWGGSIRTGMTDFVMQHNTVIPPPNLGYCKASYYFDISGTAPFNPPYSRTHNIWVLDNVLCLQIWGPTGFVGQLPYALPDYMGDPAPPDPRLLGNVFYAPKPYVVYPVPQHNYTSTLPFTYVNASGGNYQLVTPNWTDTSDGQISGINNSTLP